MDINNITTLVPKSILIRAKGLANMQDYSSALNLIQDNKIEIEIDEAVGVIRMNVPNPRFRPAESYFYAKKYGKGRKKK